MSVMTSTILFYGIFLIAVQMVMSDIRISNEFISKCKKEIGYEGDFSNPNFSDPAFPKEAKCVMACGLEKQKVLLSNGTIDISASVETVEKMRKGDEGQKIIKILKDCEAEVKLDTDKCENAFQFMKCLHSKQ